MMNGNLVFMNRSKPYEVMLYHSREGYLKAVLGGEPMGRVKLVRCFPYSLPDRLISVRTADTGKELLLLPSLDQLEEESRIAAVMELEREYTIPRIERIVSIRKKGPEWIWSVETDYGPSMLHMSILHEGIHSLADGRWIVTDDDGRRFELSNLDRMDQRSRDQWEKIG
ncbi:DUF1854 domain-containing protein [Paenibacillus sp. FSL W8-1187]|uniref:DUF1854 domain-containing protein n=2 Tax=Paenibacillus TaxID=44249 RepID=UPI000A04C7BF|nr:DUF1854 domain-containing protein [Paenibacillus pasadenensis]QGG55293.1 DUF1854 domain-containing protein [Paenibacillus sp. B01]